MNLVNELFTLCTYTFRNKFIILHTSITYITCITTRYNYYYLLFINLFIGTQCLIYLYKKVLISNNF